MSALCTPHCHLSAQFGIAFSMTMLYPFLPFMTEFLVPDVSETEIGIICRFNTVNSIGCCACSLLLVFDSAIYMFLNER